MVRPIVADEVVARSAVGGAADSSLTVSEERAWVERIRAGDAPAFELLYRAYHIRLRAFVASYVRSDAIAEEVVQDLMCHLWQQRAAWEVKGTVRSYLYLAARNRALNVAKHSVLAVRMERQWNATTSEDTAIPGMGQGVGLTDGAVQHQDLVAAIRAVVASLPERTRRAWQLRWQHELSQQEIAAVMGISVKGVEALLARSQRLLKQALSPLR